MKIFLPDMHKNFTRSMCYVLGELLGYKVYLPDASWAKVIGYGDKWNTDKLENYFYNNANVDIISWDDFKSSDIDIVICPCIEQQNDIITNIITQFRGKFKYVSYYGNEYSPGYIQWEFFKNHLSADMSSHLDAGNHGVHTARILPPIKYEEYPFRFNITSNRINTYIHYYQYSWKTGYSIYNAVKSLFPGLVFTHYGKHGEVEVDEKEMHGHITNSIATIHLKDREGYGLSVIESMASGRPIIGYRPLIATKRFTEWVTEDVSILFNGPEELIEKLGKFTNDIEYRMDLQHKCSKKIKQIIDPAEQAIILKKFMESVV